MSKRLEDFIKAHCAEFDDIEPGNDLWARVEHNLPLNEDLSKKQGAKSFTLGFVMRVAAIVILVMGVGFVLYLKKVSNATTINLADINPEYAKQQVQYASLVENKRIELKTLAKNDPQLYHEFSLEISAMDSTYKKLNNDLATSPNQERVLRAMIRNLQIQTQVLNQQLQVIEQFNQIKKEQDHAIKNI